jgi:quercetin dioxygenase-like cupin family protein
MTAAEIAQLARDGNCVTEVLMALRDGAVRRFHHVHGLRGNLMTRPFQLDAGESLPEHAHNYDHTTVVFTGLLACRTVAPDGTVSDAVVYAAGSEILIRAGVKHKLVALEDGTTAKCYFARQRACPKCGELVMGHADGSEQADFQEAYR